MKRLIILLMMMATVATAGGYVSGGGGGVTQNALDSIVYGQSFPMPSASGTMSPDDYYTGGFYEFAASTDSFVTPGTFGTANGSYAAHVMFVADAGAIDTELTVTGTSITDEMVRTAGDSETVAINDAALGTYYETSKKWIGQVTITKSKGTSRLCNYGFCKYWDHRNQDFTLVGGEVLWHANATNQLDVKVYHHKSTGWTYNAAAEPDPPTALFSLASVHGAESYTVANEPGCIKIVMPGAGTSVLGSQSEGIVIKVTTAVNNQLNFGQITVDYNNQ